METPFFLEQQPISYEQFVACAVDPNRHVAVEACAGSGKTWLLVSRIIRALLAGVLPGQILAITFTRKAAQEMQQRVFNYLAMLEQADSEQLESELLKIGVPLADIQQHAVDIRQLRQRVLFASQPITFKTFHAWFTEIIAQAPLGASAMKFAELTESTQSLLEDTWIQWIEKTAQEVTWQPVLARLVRRYGYDGLKNMTMAFIKSAAVDWHVWCWEHSDPLQVLLDRYREGLSTILTAPSWADGQADPVCMQRLRGLCQALAGGSATEQGKALPLQQLLEQEQAPLHDFIAVIQELFYTREGKKRARILTQAAIKKASALFVLPVEEEIEVLRTWIEGAKERDLAESSLRQQEDFFRCMTTFIPMYDQAKRSRGVFSFSDLEIEAVRLLESEDIAAAMHSRQDTAIRQVLIDEFQDTNPMQWRAMRAWIDPYLHGETGFDAPKIFIVGDPKQSIYRFRRAEPRLFEVAQQFLKTHFQAVLLTTNLTRRCGQAVVASLNASLLGTQYPIYAEHQTSVAHQGEVVKLPFIERIVAAASEDQVGEAYPKQREATQIAQAILQIRANSSEQEATDWSDILVLMRSRTHLSELEYAFRQAGIPYFSDRQGALLHTLEAQDMMALLRLLFMPWDDYALTHTLRTPLFNASTDLLSALMTLADTAVGLERLPQIQERFPQVMSWYEQLKTWEGWAKVFPVHDLLDRIYAETNLLVRYAQSVEPSLQKKVVANLQRILYLALDVQGGRYPSPQQLFEYLLEQTTVDIGESTGEAIIDAGNVVRVMTVHAAKGLEAPVVILAFTNQRENNDRHIRPVVEWPPEERAPVYMGMVFDKESQDFVTREAVARDQFRQQQEDWNVLYVAMSRAQTRLLVSGSGDLQETSWYGRVVASESSFDIDDGVGTSSERLSNRVESLVEIHEFLPEPLHIGEVQALERDVGRAMGQMMHWYLEEYWQDWTEEAMLFHTRATAAIWGLTEVQQRLAWQAAQNILQGEGARWFAENAILVEKELELMTQDGSVYRVDRLVEWETEVWVIDFKISMMPEEQPGYEAQVRTYQRIVQQSYPHKPVKSVLLIGDGRVHIVGSK